MPLFYSLVVTTFYVTLYARVLEAGATVVFASDLNSMKNVGKLT